MTDFFDFDPRLLEIAKRAEAKCQEEFKKRDEIFEYNSAKVLSAFLKNNISEAHLKGTSGYGSYDLGRDDLEKVYSDIFHTEDAIVRHGFVSGTHTLAVALFGMLRPGDTMLSVIGRPYDTLEEVIGLRGEKGVGALMDFGINYEEVDLLSDGTPDYEEIAKRAKGVQMIYIQRSRGYSLRPSLTIDVVEKVIKAARSTNKDAIVMVDNCYCELVEKKEATDVGADIMAGSLIKNLGAGITPTGGYIAGRKDLVEKCACRLTCPGVGKEEGCTLDVVKSMYLGLFMAPQVVTNAVKNAIFAAAFYNELGFKAVPAYNEPRADIVESILCGGSDQLVTFCQGIQKFSPIDSFARPEPCAMSGYDDEVVMASGSFNTGSTIELSADGPLREPFAVWLQGGLTYPTAKLGVISSAQELLNKGYIKL